MSKSKLIVALDFSSIEESRLFLDKIRGADCRVKVGKELFTSAGPKIIDLINEFEFEIFLDLKFHDIPNTVNKAVKAAAKLGVWMINVHASGGKRMMMAAKEALISSNQKPLLTAVTILTSLNNEEFLELGYKASIENQVKKYALLAEESGMDGIVCSADEIKLIKPFLINNNFKFVTPGIRPNNYSSNDQSRIATPENAIAEGSSFIVVGRPITLSNNPKEVIDLINKETS